MAASVSPLGNVVLLRPSVCGQHCLYRSWKLCHEHCRRSGFRLQLVVGAAVVERDGHSHTVSVGQTGHRDRPHPTAKLPIALLKKGQFGALGFYLLFNINLLLASLITGVCVFLILASELYGFRRLEQVIMAFVFGIAACYAIEIFLARPDWGRVAHHILVPQLNSGSVYI